MSQNGRAILEGGVEQEFAVTCLDWQHQLYADYIATGMRKLFRCFDLVKDHDRQAEKVVDCMQRMEKGSRGKKRRSRHTSGSDKIYRSRCHVAWRLSTMRQSSVRKGAAKTKRVG